MLPIVVPEIDAKSRHDRLLVRFGEQKGTHQSYPFLVQWEPDGRVGQLAALDRQAKACLSNAFLPSCVIVAKDEPE